MKNEEQSWKATIKESGHDLNRLVTAFDTAVKLEARLRELVEEEAKTIRECVLFNKVAHVSDEWLTAAKVISCAGNIDRFKGPASLWHFCGLGDVKSKERDFNPELRDCLVRLGESITKDSSNPWSADYEMWLAEELAQHDEKCPGCKTKQGHCEARSRRKVVKEMLKEFYLAATNTEYRQDTAPSEET